MQMIALILFTPILAAIIVCVVLAVVVIARVEIVLYESNTKQTIYRDERDVESEGKL